MNARAVCQIGKPFNIRSVVSVSARLSALLTMFVDDPFVVENVEVDNAGGLKLSKSYSFEVFPDNSFFTDEHWKLFSPDKKGCVRF